MKLSLLEKLDSWFEWYYSTDSAAPPYASATLLEELRKEIDREKGVFVDDAPLEDFSMVFQVEEEYKSSVRELSKWLNEGRCDHYPVDKQALAVVLSRAQIQIDRGE